MGFTSCEWERPRRHRDGTGLDRLAHYPASTAVRGQATLGELMGIVLALDERAELDPAERRRLDGEVRARLGDASAGGLGLLRIWWQVVANDALRERVDALRRALFAVSFLLAVVGFAFGWVAASGLLSIKVLDGRVNVILCVVLLVAVPFLFFVAGAVGWLVSLRGAGNGASRSILTLLYGLGAGRLMLRWISRSVRQNAESLIGRMTAHQRLYGRVEHGQLLIWSQTFGVAFGVGALTASLAFVAFTDLAFGWSTTLDVSASGFHRGVRLLALPWASLWPAASPSLELVELTRFFRVAPTPSAAAVDPLVYGGWWPFLVMSIVTYAIMPRCLLWLAARVWLHRQTARAIGLTPGVDRLLDRLANPIVESQAIGPEGEIGRSSGDLVPAVEGADWIERSGGPEPLVLRWAELSVEAELRRALGVETMRLFEVGGRRTLEEDEQVARDLATEPGGVVFCVRGYEPPVLDVLDFLGSVRDAIGNERPLLVALFGARASDHSTWRRKLMSLGDPMLAVAALGSVDG